MVSAIICMLTAVFIYMATVKYKLSTAESVFFLISLSFLKTCLNSLFIGGAVFTIINIGTIQIHIDDVIAAFLLFSCKSIYKTGIKKNSFSMVLLIYALPLLFSFTVGLISYFPSSDFLNDTRKFVFMYITIYASFRAFRDASKDQLKSVASMIHILMNFVAIGIIIVWVLDLFFGINYLSGQIGGTKSDGGSTFRIIPSNQAFAISIYTLWQFFDNLIALNKIRIRTLLFVIIILFLQLRTVLAAFLIGAVIGIICFTFVKKIKIKKALLVQVIIVLFIFFIFTFLLTGRMSAMLNNLFNSYDSIAENTGTFSTRVWIWQQLLGSLNNLELLIGPSFGSGYSDTVQWTASAHNAYVDYIMVAGIVGLIAFLILIFYILIKLFKLRHFISFAVICSMLVYWYGYGFSMEQAAIIGFVFAMIYIEDYNYRYKKIAYVGSPL